MQASVPKLFVAWVMSCQGYCPYHPYQQSDERMPAEGPL